MRARAAAKPQARFFNDSRRVFALAAALSDTNEHVGRPRARLRWCCGFAVILVLSAPARAILSRSGLGAAYGPREASLEYFFDGLSETLVGAFFDVSNEL